MKALKQIFGLLLAVLFMLEGASCTTAKKSVAKQKGWVYNSAGSHSSKSKLRYKI
ncbi:MAG: hypothetical protein ACXVO9_15055 [Bacteroidia bacterium]